jgi:hypothetical protein
MLFAMLHSTCKLLTLAGLQQRRTAAPESAGQTTESVNCNALHVQAAGAGWSAVTQCSAGGCVNVQFIYFTLQCLEYAGC